MLGDNKLGDDAEISKMVQQTRINKQTDGQTDAQ